MQTHRQGRRPYRAETLVQQDHATLRAEQRTMASPGDVAKLRAALRHVDLPPGTHHTTFGGGHAVLKDVGRTKKRHVVATVLSRGMRPPGHDMSAYFRKQAEAIDPRIQRDAEILARVLKPGDLVHTGWKPGMARGLFSNVGSEVTRLFQGSPYTHSALYEGNGRVLELNRVGDTGRAEIKRTPLSDILSHSRIVAQRPQLSAIERQQAVARLRKRLGEGLPSTAFTVNAAKTILPWARKDPRGPLPAEALMCSAAVADAYQGKLVSKAKVDTKPGDIQRSPLVKTVAKYAALGVFEFLRDAAAAALQLGPRGELSDKLGAFTPRVGIPTARMAPMPPKITPQAPAPVGVPQVPSVARAITKPSMEEMQKAAGYDLVTSARRRRERAALWQTLRLGQSSGGEDFATVSLPQDPAYLAALSEGHSGLVPSTTPLKDLIAGRRLPLYAGGLT